MSGQVFSRFWQWLLGTSPKVIRVARFVDLAPTDSAENADIYFEALDYATNNNQVLNIALTGPYGSGKSSIIKSFLKRYPRKSLQLSLAAFLPEGELPGLSVSKQEIERSILQQILYGVEADRLPFSRFKRIQPPKRTSVATSFFITVGVAAAWYLFTKQADFMSGALLDPFELGNWFNYLCVVIVAAFAWKLIHSVYTASFGLSLKSISLKDVQIAPAAANEESILNRHLDEILYFFQSTDYDLVVVEDLDRFENPEIFVTLREINGLINANEGIRRRVRFLYALRDDIFANTDRTKFFEFIVPVIPIINHSNSIDKVLEQGHRIAVDERLDRQFLREVSRYLTDLRLIRNVFNEYVVYATNLNADEDGHLDANKLLAVLIYKNVIPQDFAALHRQEGALASILGRYDQYVAKVEQGIQQQIAEIEAAVETGQSQALRDQSELRKVYAMAIVERIPAGYHTVLIPDARISLGELAESAELERIISQKSILVAGPSRMGVDIGDIQNSVDPSRSFEQRKADINSKSAKFKKNAEKRIGELRRQLSSLRTRRFNEVVRESADLIDEVFAEVGENRELLKYLVLEGHLDDTYYQYISLFHSGRLSPNDNSFLIQIRAYGNPPPDFPLDNVAEVIASMRPADFGHVYVLNRFIVDHLLSDAEAHSGRIEKVMEFVTSNFRGCAEFFRSYYAAGTQVESLVRMLAEKWPSFAAVAVSGPDAASHASRFLAYAPDRIIAGVANAEALRSFVSDNLREVLAEGQDFELERLRSLGVEVTDVGSLDDFPTARSFVAQHGLYRISIDNIEQIVERIVRPRSLEDLAVRHFSTVKEVDDAALHARIYDDFPKYVGDVLLALTTNTQEHVSAISEVLARDEVEHELRVEFLRRQTARFQELDDIPAPFHGIAMLERKVEPTWENCLRFMASEAFEPEVLTDYLQEPETADELARQPVPDEGSDRLVTFLVENDALNPQIYRSYIRRLAKRIDYFPEVDAARLSILIEERKVGFGPETFEMLQEADLQVMFVAANFPAFVARKDEYGVGDEFSARLLRTGITNAQKLALIRDMAVSFVVGTPSVAAEIGSVLDRAGTSADDYRADFVKAVILNTRAVFTQISLFNKLHPALSNAEVREVLQGLPAPFCDIAKFGRSPKIPGNDLNRQLVRWLKDRSVISSFGDSLLGNDIRINTFKKEV